MTKIFLNSKFLRDFALVLFASFILSVTVLSVANSQVMPGSTIFISAISKPNSKGSSTSQISLEIQESRLCEALNDLSQKSGIKFNCPDRLRDHILFPRVLEESNWVALIRVLLEDYNIIEIWNKKGKMTQVYLLGDRELNTTSSPGTRVKKARNRNDNKSVTESIKQEGVPGSGLTKGQLFVLLQTSTYRPMPSHMFKSPDFREVLSFAGIESPQDWLDLKKSKLVKQQVQKLLNLKKN